MTGISTASSYEILVGADAFFRRLKTDIASASRRVLVQAMTLEADGAGLGLIRALEGSGAPDRRILADAYNYWVINDRFVGAPLARRDRALQEEARATRRLLSSSGRQGISIRITNPRRGPCMLRYPMRNHKKIIVVDREISYIGGINFSDHNFAWHDMMIRCRNLKLAAFLADDFDATWQGVNLSRRADFGAGTVYCLDGERSRHLYRQILSVVAAARDSVVVHSPYLTRPFTGALVRAADRGASVTVLLPEQNNKPLIHPYLAGALDHPSIVLRQIPGAMSHLKAMVIDGQRLIAGSSNFDLVSYRLEQEVMVLFDDKALGSDFVRQVLTPDLARSREMAASPPAMMSSLGRAAVAAADSGFRLIGRIFG